VILSVQVLQSELAARGKPSLQDSFSKNWICCEGKALVNPSLARSAICWIPRLPGHVHYSDELFSIWFSCLLLSAFSSGHLFLPKALFGFWTFFSIADMPFIPEQPDIRQRRSHWQQSNGP
jgi:hypothetical protein